MNRLGQYISENKHLFEEEPATGHFERLQQRMSRKARQTVILRWSVSVAATIAILFSFGILSQLPEKENNMIIACENAQDMKACYRNEMNAVAGQIVNLTKDFDIWDQQQVLDDVQNIINSTNDDFENEIPDELPYETTRLILSDYYQRNLESLNDILKTLNND